MPSSVEQDTTPVPDFPTLLHAALLRVVELTDWCADHAEDAAIYRDLSAEAMHKLHEAREHALKQGRVIRQLREHIKFLMGVQDELPAYELEGEPWQS